MKKINQTTWDYLKSLSEESKLNEWVIGELIAEESTFGTQTVVSSLTNPIKYDGIILFSDEKEKVDKIGHFIDVISKNIEIKILELNLSKYFLLPEKIIKLENDGKTFYFLLFPEYSLSKPLSKKINFNAKTFQCSPDEKLHRVLLSWLLEYLKIAGGKFSHSYLCPETIIIYNDDFKLILPGFVSLLSETETNNITTILHKYPDLEVYPLAQEYINDLRYDINSNHRSDFWSVGVIDALLLTGNPPFTITSEPQYLTAIRNKILELYELKDSELTHRLTKLLQYDPDKREIPAFDNSSAHVSSQIPATNADHEAGTGVSVFPRGDFIINPNNRVEIILTVVFDKLLNRSFLIEGGRRFKVTPEVDLTLSSTVEYCFTVLPEPQILFQPSNSKFQRTENENEYELSFSFRLLKSTINIQRIELSINQENGNTIHTEDNVQWEGLNKNIVFSDREYQVYTKLKASNGHTFNQGEFYGISFNFILKDWGIYLPQDAMRLKLVYPGIPKLEANLSNLRYPTSVRDKKDLILKNVGGEDITIRSLHTSRVSQVVSVGITRIGMNKTRIEPGGKIQIDLLINTSNIPEGYHEEGHIVVMYTTLSSTSSFSSKFFYHVSVSSFGRKEINIAIDFGTSNTCLYYDNGERRSLFVWRDKREYIPSFICYSPNYEDPLWGEKAKDIYTALDGQDVFHSIKKEIGKNGISVPVRTYKGTVNKSYNQMADDYLQLLINRLRFDEGYDIGEIFLSYPTSFGRTEVNTYKTIAANIPQRSNSSIKVFDEALCGAYSYLAKSGNNGEYYLVYDFGGGTTDILFARYIEEEEGFPFPRMVKKIIKIFSSGFDIGGEDLNEWLCQVIAKKFFQLSGKDELVIPFVKKQDARRFNTLVVNECDKFKGARENASRKLWLISEKLKIEDFKFETSEEFKLDVVKGSSLGAYQEWNSAFTKDNITEINLATEEKFNNAMSDIRELFYKKFEEVLQVKLDKLFEFIHPVLGTNKLNLILLGQSSKFGGLKTMFEKVCQNKNISLDIHMPEELKTVVVQGCFELGVGRNTLRIDDSSVKKYLIHGDQPYILPDKKIVTNPISFDLNKDAVHKTPVFSILDLVDTINFSELHNPYEDPKEIMLNFDTANIRNIKKKGNVQVTLYLYYPADRTLRWLLLNENGDNLAEGSA